MRDRELDREIGRLAIPAFATLLSEPLYLLTDTAIVGHLGTRQLAGLAVATSILLTVHSLATFLAYGTTSSVARLLGAGHREEAAHQAVQGLWLALGLGTTAAVVGAIATRPLVGVFGAHGSVTDHAVLYLRVSLLGLPALLITLAGTGYLRGRRDTRTPLAVAVGSATLNLVLELVLITGLGFGLGASAAATVAHVTSPRDRRESFIAVASPGVSLGSSPPFTRVGRGGAAPRRAAPAPGRSRRGWSRRAPRRSRGR